jgi:hypothetical protein
VAVASANSYKWDKRTIRYYCQTIQYPYLRLYPVKIVGGFQRDTREVVLAVCWVAAVKVGRQRRR